MFNPSTPSLLSILGAMIGTGGIYNGAKIGLFVNSDLTPTGATKLTEFTPPVYTGYAMKTVAWGTPHGQADGSAQVTGAQLAWTIPDADSSFICYGYYMTDGAGTTYLGAERFDTPQAVPDPTRAALVTPHLEVTRP